MLAQQCNTSFINEVFRVLNNTFTEDNSTTYLDAGGTIVIHKDGSNVTVCYKSVPIVHITYRYMNGLLLDIVIKKHKLTKEQKLALVDVREIEFYKSSSKFVTMVVKSFYKLRSQIYKNTYDSFYIIFL